MLAVARCRCQSHSMPPDSRKSFTTRRNNQADTPLPFDINGEEFKAYPSRIPASILMDIPGMSVSMDSAPMWELFKCALGDDYPRFRTMVRSPEWAIEADEIAQIITWLGEEAGEHPTLPSSS